MSEIKEFIKIVGKRNVVTDIKALKAMETTTFATKQKIRGVIYPLNRLQIQKCVEIANKLKIKIYTISTGKNIGLGGEVPVVSNCYVLHLSKMTKIIDFDEDLGYITVESGVTQKQVADFLIKQNSNNILSPTGSLGESSIIGNTLERGDTRGPVPQRVEMVSRLGVVIPTGEYLETGFGRFSNAKTANLSKYGVGPDITGLFIQSNLGIVTQATIWLSKKHKYKETILFTVETERQLEETIDTILHLKLQGLIPHVDIFNDYKIFTAAQQYPFDSCKNIKELQLYTYRWRKKRMLGKWNGFITIGSANKKSTKILSNDIKTLLKPSVENIISTGEIKFKIIKYFRYIIENLLRKDIKLLTLIPESPLFNGYPSSDAFKGIYWKKKAPVPKNCNPNADKCGFHWIALAIPLKGAGIAHCTNLAQKILIKHGFEPNISLLCISERLVTMNISIIYDRENLQEEANASKCHDKILQDFTKKGYYPNRLGIQSMALLPKSDNDYDIFVQRLKKLLDPNNIMSPGKYDLHNI